MAWETESYKAFHPFSRDFLPKSSPGDGINWNVFFWMWFVILSRHWMQVVTPWFALTIACGRQSFIYSSRDYGVSLHWSPAKKWRAHDGCHMFHKADNFRMISKPELQETW